jgi:hypothetical protein
MRTVERQFTAATSGRALWLTLAVLLALGAFTHWADRPPAPQPADAPADVFSAERAAHVLQELVGTGIPHPLASAADARIRAQLVQHLHALGIATELQEGWTCDVVLACGRVVNIIGRIEGTEPASAGVLLAAHYDSVPAGPGAGDDGIGVASVLEIARILKQQPQRRHPIILLIDEGEEAGLLGARLFVAERPEAHAIKAAVNLDARGDSGPSLMFETGPATDWALRVFASVAARPMSNSLYYFVYKLLPNDTDFTVFKAAGYEGFNFALIGDVERYHTPQDRFENLDLGSLQHQGQNALSVVQALAMADLAAPPPAGAVFFDVFSRTLWHWPASGSLWFGLALTAALGYALWRVKRRVGVPVLAIVYGFAALMIGWAGAVVLSAALLTLVRVGGAVPPAAAYSWAAYPTGMHAACIALALLAPAGAAKLFRRRIDAWSLWFAYLKLQAALALLCAWKFPELSYLFFSPVLAGLIAALLAMRILARAPATAPPPPLTAALPVVGAAFTFIPILLLLYPALGADAWPVITALAGLAALGLAPLLRETPARSFRAYAGVAALIVIVGSGVTVLMPAYSTQMPQRTLLWYLLDADAGKAAWLLQPDSKRLPPQLALHAGNPAQPSTLPAGNIAGPVVSTAPHLDYPAPLLQILGVENRASTVLYHLHVRSVRNAPEIELAVAADRPLEATLDLSADHKLPAHFWRASDGSRWLQLIGVPPEGLDLTLKTSNSTDLAVTFLDRSYGVPATGAALRAARPALTTQSQDGDLTIVYRSVRLSATENAPGS